MHRIWGWKRLACLLALAATANLYAQKYPFLAIPNAPHGIYQIFQDSHSGLWLGTINDVVRFDGQHFYSLRPYGFPKEIPNSFAEDDQGGLWIATQGTDVSGGTGRGGLYRYQSGHVEKILSGDGLTILPIAPGLMLASMGTEAAGKPSYGDLVLLSRSANGWSPTPLLQKQSDHLSIDHQDNLLFPCPNGWCEIPLAQVRNPTAAPLNPQRHAGSNLIERVLRDKFGCVWLRAEAFASYQCPADPKPVLIDNTISAFDSSAHLEETQDGNIFMLVKLTLGRPGAFHSASAESGVPEPIDYAMVAKDGTIWVGADSGLYRFMYPFQMEYWDQSLGIGLAGSILLKGNDIFATSTGLQQLNRSTGHWDRIPNTNIFRGSIVDGPGDTFYVGGNGILGQFNTKGALLRSSDVPFESTFPSETLARTSDGITWMGRTVVHRVLENGRSFTFPAENVPPGGIAAMEYDRAHDTLWACDGNTVLFRKDRQWRQITPKDGLLNLPCTSIGIEPGGDVWIGYSTKAISRIQDPASSHPQIRNFTQWLNEFSANRATKFLKVDPHNRLWWATDRFYISSLAAAQKGDWIPLDLRDWPVAQAGPEPAPEAIYDFQTAADGSVWLATGSGISHFAPPADFATNLPAPPIWIAGFSQGAALKLADTLGPISRNTALVAHIGSLQFDRRTAVRLRYRIAANHPWTDATGFDLPLGALGWGRHTLQVQAQMATGPWSPIAEQTLEVPWPLWLTWPAWLLYLTCSTALVVTLRHWYRRYQFEQNLPLPDLTAWRLGALAPETEALIGTVIDSRYEVGHILSVGGFATVARVRDLRQNNTLCAIKIFRYEMGDRAWIRHRFEQEIKALEQVKHPNIVRITGHGAIPTGAPYLVMEFIHGRSLRELLENGAMERPLIATFLRQLAEALALLHQAQIFHRDLKPENLMIRTQEGDQPQIVLIDFSIAIVKAPDQTFHGISRVAGTLDYMAPEQVIGYADASTDIYSLAKVILEMVTGLRWTEFLPEAKLDLPQQLREYFREHPELFSPVSIEMLATALAFDPSGRPKEVQVFAKPIILDLEH